MRPFDPRATEGKPGGSAILDELIEQARESFRSLVRAVTNDAVVTVTLSTAPTQVFHGLGQPPLTVEVVGQNAGEVIFEPPTLNSQRARFVLLQATGAVTASIRFTARAS